MPTIELFSYPTSPFAQKVGCYLKFKQLDFTFVPVNPLNPDAIAFTKQRQVPVLKIDEQWRKESSELGIWLDEVFPNIPILPNDAEAKHAVLEVDAWLSEAVFPSIFRHAVQWQKARYSIANGWRLARAVNNATPLPFYARLLWPFGIKKAGFIVDMVQKMDLQESIPQMNQRLQNTFITHLGKGPFLAEQNHPTLADLSAFPAVTSGYFMGMQAQQMLIDHPMIRAWAERVYAHLPENPFLVPDKLLKRSL